MTSTVIPPVAVGKGPLAPPRVTRLGLTRVDSAEPQPTDLSSDPQTIGGGPRCSIRLDAEGLRPLHCVVTPTAAGPVIRRWATETRLNDADFTEATLEAGDRLTVGEIELVVVDLEQAAPLAAPEFDPIGEASLTEEPFAEAPIAEEAAATCEPPQAIEPTREEPTVDPEASADAVMEAPQTENPIQEEERAEDFSDEAAAESSATLEPCETAPEPAENGAEDPAVPRHLLQPWTPTTGAASSTPIDSLSEEPAEEASPSDLEEAVAEETPEQPVEQVAEQPANDWLIEPVEGAEAEPASDLTNFAATSTADDDNPWAVALVEAENHSAAQEAESHEDQLVEVGPLEPCSVGGSTDFDEAAAASFAAASPVAEADTDVPSEAVQGITPAVDDAFARRLRVRLASNRQRVGRLVASLRDHRERFAALEATVAQRDEAITALQEQLNQSMAAAELASNELGRLITVASRLEATETELAAATQAADEATRRAEVLEQRVRELEEAARLTPAEAVTDEASEASAEPSNLEPVTTDAPSDEPSTAAEEKARAMFAGLWNDEPSAATDPETAEPTPAELHAGESPVDEGVAEEIIAEKALAAEQPLWGIERLTPEESPQASLWGEPVAVSPETEEEPAGESSLDFASVPSAPTPYEEAHDEPVYEAPLPVEETAEYAVEAEQEPHAEPEAEYAPSDVEPETYAEQMQMPGDAAYDEAPVEEAVAEEGVAEEAAPDAGHEQEQAAPSAEAPASFIEQYAHLLPEDDESVEAPEPVAEPVAELAAEPVAAQPMEEPAGETGEDESIDDYMRRLMARMRGDSEPAAAPAAPAPAAAQPQSTQTTSQAAPTEEPMTPAKKVEERIRDISELKRNAIPLANADLGELRQLANQSARHAINVADTRENREHAVLRLTISGVVVVCGVLAAFTAADPLSLQSIGGIVGAVAGGWFSFQTLRACKPKQEKAQAAASAE